MPPQTYVHDEIHDPASLLEWVTERAKSRDGRKLVFVVGAPLTEPERGSEVGVANVTHMIDLVLRKIESRRPPAAAELRRRREEEVLDGEMYQQAMSKLGEVFDEATVNEVVRSGVLKALAPAAYAQAAIQARVAETEFLRHIESETPNWSLRSGVEALGRLLSGEFPGIAPLVLTSNFDPLIEVAVRKIGGEPQTVWFDNDGTIDNLDLSSRPVKVVHFHGWWLKGNTLHTAPMLTSSRPMLCSSLERLLSRFVLVPIAYGGWTDVFTTALLESCRQNSEIDVRWGLYQTHKAKAMGECAHLIGRYPPNRVRFYRGVDCHKFFPDLVERLVTASAPRTSGATVFAASPQPLPTMDMSSAIDWDSVRMLRRAVEDRTPGSSGNGDDWSFLENRLGILVRDQEQRLAPTREAILLFGTTDAVRRLLHRPVVDLQVRQDAGRIDPTVRWSGREVIEENLVRARLRLLDRFLVTMRNELDDGRVDGAASGVATGKPRYIAFREAAINLLVHQSYEPGTAKGLIELGEHGWHFDNAGCPGVADADLVSPTPLPYRNPLLNQAFRDAGWTENGKTGLRAMSAAWMRLGRAPPKVSLVRATDRFQVEFPFEARTTLQADAWIAQLGMSPTEVQQDFLGLLARKIRDKAEFQLAMALPTQEFAAVLSWGVLQGVIEESDLERGIVAPTPSFAARMPTTSNQPAVPLSATAGVGLSGIDDTSLHILGLVLQGINTTTRLEQIVPETRSSIRSRLRQLQQAGLLNVDETPRTHLWSLTDAGQKVATDIAR